MLKSYDDNLTAMLCVLGCLGVLGVFAAGCSFGSSAGIEQTQREAIVAGVANWVKGEKGEPKFEWIKR